MPLVPLIGHDALRRRLGALAAHNALPASLLLQGPAGIGKQRLALWLGQVLLCEGTERPCGTCEQCRYSAELTHPDLRWFFPRPRLGPDPSIEEVQEDYESAVRERVEARGLYPRPDGSAGMFISLSRLLVQMASRTPALARRKVFVIGDAERMTPQTASPHGANAFLKLLEEPPADTTLILTSSEPGALLPTIRSRVVVVRVAPLTAEQVRRFVAEPLVAGSAPNEQPEDLVRTAGGAPGTLIGAADRTATVARARQLLAAADGGREQLLRAAFGAGASKARGAFADVLDAMTVLLHERARDAAQRGDERVARSAVRAIPAVEEAKRAADGNANPQLVTASLLSELARISG